MAERTKRKEIVKAGNLESYFEKAGERYMRDANAKEAAMDEKEELDYLNKLIKKREKAERKKLEKEKDLKKTKALGPTKIRDDDKGHISPKAGHKSVR